VAEFSARTGSRAYGVRGYCARGRGQLLQARSSGERGLQLAREIADAHAEFFCLRMLAVTFGRLGRHRDGITCGERALRIARDLDSGTYGCAALYTLINARLLAGQPREVIDLCSDGLALSAKTGHELVRAHFYQQMGIAYQQLRWHQDAIEMLATAAADFASRHDRYQTACCLRVLSDSYQATGRHDEAISHLRESITAFRALGIDDKETEATKALAKHHTPNKAYPDKAPS
jgi:tetratricopeptide (TPR) repeat protein